ncbi:MAG: hypothetical protein IPI76_16815 [Chloracidobacterium sp.]|nr:hypothetical protein [Chloracidobacterium sp.]
MKKTAPFEPAAEIVMREIARIAIIARNELRTTIERIDELRLNIDLSSAARGCRTNTNRWKIRPQK